MAGPLLKTKLHVPTPRRDLVARPRLGARLGPAVEAALTLVSAPAGFGKTTLLAEWLAAVSAGGPAVAWLSLDQRDNDPVLFWRYLIASLDAAVPGIGADALALLEAPRSPVEAVLAAVLNDLHGLAHDVVLVLDDYHVIDSPAVHDGMGFLLEHLPAQAHLVIAGRADPPLPVARLRARGELVELRAADLRFTADEAAAYLTGVMGLALAANDVAALEQRTEGWIAALQLAALSMRGRDDLAAFTAGFAGDDRHIVDYLAEEVLQRQPEHVRQFLLRTSILDRLSGPLCDAVTGQDGGRATLAALERENLFLVPLDDRRRWYRYHQLFADVLQAHLRDEQPDRVADLHERASRWHEHEGDTTEAIRHALAAGDFGRAADLAEASIPAMRRDRQEASVRGWLALLPDEVVRVRPVLSVAFAWALLARGELDGVEDRLREAARWLDPDASPPGEMVVVDAEEFAHLPATIEVYRAAHALARGDLPGTIEHARRGLDLTAGDELWGAPPAGLLGLASWAGGDLDAAHAAYTVCMAGLRRAGHVSDALGCAIAMADIRLAQGRPGAAMREYEQALRLVPDAGGPVVRGTADMYVGMSELHRERGDLAAATRLLLHSQELGEQAGLPQNRYRWQLAMARVRAAEGDLDGALGLLDEAQRRYVGDFFPDVRPIAAWRARLRLARGEVDEALGWVRERGLSAADDLGYLREFEHITLARVLLAGQAERPREDAMRLLDRLLRAAEDGRRTGSVIELLVLRALACRAGDDVPAALEALRRALALAEPEGYVRLFVDEGRPMAALLRALGKEQGAWAYPRRLLAALEPATDRAPVAQALVEPLSERELAVLRLLGTDLAGPDIARRLSVSLNTVRTHTQHIYTKLGVGNRRAAVRRAAELDLL